MCLLPPGYLRSSSLSLRGSLFTLDPFVVELLLGRGEKERDCDKICEGEASRIFLDIQTSCLSTGLDNYFQNKQFYVP